MLDLSILEHDTHIFSPLAVEGLLAPGSPIIEAASIPLPPTSFTLEHPLAQPGPKAARILPSKDFNYLLRPEIYHPLSQLVYTSPRFCKSCRAHKIRRICPLHSALRMASHLPLAQSLPFLRITTSALPLQLPLCASALHLHHLLRNCSRFSIPDSPA